MADSYTTPATNVEAYTALREAADGLLKYVAFGDLSEQNNAKVSVQNLANPRASAESSFCEQLLGSSEAVPDNNLLSAQLQPASKGGRLSEEEAKDPGIILHTPTLMDSKIDPTRNISLVYHKARTKVDFASSLSDISALFCNLMPTTELSLCVPYFDVRIFYPKEPTGLGKLSPFRFVGIGKKQSESFDETNTEDQNLIGTDVAGMEIFCMPQTLVGQNSQINSPEMIEARGLQAIDPSVPLMTLESANVQQVGVGGSLYAQTKVDLKLVLHDRSRLSDIEPLISVEVFPTVTFRIEYGWSHPDTNDMMGGAYAKLLNRMRVKQDFALYSVSVGTRDANSLNISISLVSKGDYIAKSAGIISAGGDYIPYTAVLSLLRQFVNVQSSKTTDDKTSLNPVNYVSKAGSTVIASTSDGVTSNKFVSIAAFYKFYKSIKKITDGEKADSAQLSEIIKELTALDVSGASTTLEDYTSNLFELKVAGSTKPTIYGSEITPFPITNPDGTSRYFNYSASLGNITKIESETGTSVSTDQEISGAPVVPLASLVAKLVAKPIMLSDPTISEARIHCFSFNSTCGAMAQENIGNFPIVVNDLLERQEGDKKISGLNSRSSAASAFSKILAQVNNPASKYYGFSLEQNNLDQEVKKIQEGYTPSEDSEADDAARKEAQAKIDAKVKAANAEIEQKNKDFLKAKNITGNEIAFVPPRIKYQMEVVPAYSSTALIDKPNKSILRIIIYDDRAGNFNNLGNLLFSMINNSGVATVDGSLTDSDYLVKLDPPNEDGTTNYAVKSIRALREIVSKMYPTITIGIEGTVVESATFNSQPSGEIASSYLLTATGGTGTSSVYGSSANADMADDVLVIPSTVSINMLGNVCLSRGQTYYIDFGTGTTIDNTYTVQSVSHSFRPGQFKTSATFLPVSSATMRTVTRQLNDLRKLAIRAAPAV